MYVPSFAIISHHFKRRRTTMMSIVASGAALGGVANTIMLNKLLNGPIGFKLGVRISATFITALLFLSCILMRTRYSAVRQEATSVNFWKATKKCFTEIPSLLTIIGYGVSLTFLLAPGRPHSDGPVLGSRSSKLHTCIPSFIFRWTLLDTGSVPPLLSTLCVVAACIANPSD